MYGRRVPPFGNAVFFVPFAVGNLTAVALDANLREVASTSKLTHGAAAELRLSLDAPSPLTGR